MGKFHNGVLGTMTGKVGGVVGRTWKGINTVASYQPNVSNPRTNAQVGQRNKLTGLTQLASQLNTGFIKPLWDRDAKKMSGFNAFIQANMAAVSALGVVDFTILVASKGKMTAPTGLSTAIVGTNIELTFDAAVSDAYGLPSDKAFAFAVVPSTGAVHLSSGIVDRSSGKVVLEGVYNALNDYIIYLAFRRADGSMSSNSAYTEI